MSRGKRKKKARKMTPGAGAGLFFQLWSLRRRRPPSHASFFRPPPSSPLSFSPLLFQCVQQRQKYFTSPPRVARSNQPVRPPTTSTVISAVIAPLCKIDLIRTGRPLMRGARQSQAHFPPARLTVQPQMPLRPGPENFLFSFFFSPRL